MNEQQTAPASLGAANTVNMDTGEVTRHELPALAQSAPTVEHIDRHELTVLTPHPLVAAPANDFSPKSLDEALRLCDYLADSDMVPKEYQGKPGNCLVAIQWGAEIGLKPLQSMQNISTINGRPSLWVRAGGH
jgi:hypothetical protein